MTSVEKEVEVRGIRYRVYVDKKHIVANVITPKRFKSHEIWGLTNKRFVYLRIHNCKLQPEFPIYDKGEYIEIEKTRRFHGKILKRLEKIEDNTSEVKVIADLILQFVERHLKKLKFRKSGAIGLCFPLVSRIDESLVRRTEVAV